MSKRVCILLFLLVILGFVLYQSVSYDEITAQNGAGYEVGISFPTYHFLSVAGTCAVAVFALRRSR